MLVKFEKYQDILEDIHIHPVKYSSNMVLQMKSKHLWAYRIFIYLKFTKSNLLAAPKSYFNVDFTHSTRMYFPIDLPNQNSISQSIGLTLIFSYWNGFFA